MVPLLIFSVVTAHGLSPVYQGALGFLWYLTSSIVQPLFGMYSDARGRWWFLPAAVLLTVLCVSLSGWAPNIAVLGMLIAIGGIGSAVMHPEAGKYSAMLSGSRKAGGISIFQIGGALGYSLGPLVISRLLGAYGAHGSLAMLIPGLIGSATLFATMARVDRAAVRHHETRAVTAHGVHLPADRVGVTLLVVSTGLKYFVGAAFMTYLPNVIAARGGSIALAGEMVTAFLIVGVVGLYGGGYLGDRFGAMTVSVASFVIAVPFLFGFFLLPGALGFASLLAASVLLNFQSAPGVAIIQQMMPRNLGAALGLMNGVAFGIGSALVAVVGVLVVRYGAAEALRDVSALPLLCAGLYLTVKKRQPMALKSA